MENNEIRANKIKIEDYISRLEQLKREEEIIAKELDWYFDANNYNLISNALEINGSLDDASGDFDKNIDYLTSINEKISELKRETANNLIDLKGVDIEVCKFLNDEQENPLELNVDLDELNFMIKRLSEKLQKDRENKKLIAVVDVLQDYYKNYINLQKDLKETL